MMLDTLPLFTTLTWAARIAVFSSFYVTPYVFVAPAFPTPTHSPQATAPAPPPTAPSQAGATFRRLQQDCLDDAPIVTDLRESFGLDICEISSVYAATVDQHHQARDQELELLTFVVSRLTHYSLDDVQSDGLIQYLQNGPAGERYRLFAPRTLSTLTPDQRLRWIATLALLDTYVDPALIRRIEEGVPLDRALAIALGANGYAYVDYDEAVPGTLTSATERQRAAARAAALSQGTAAFAAGNDADYLALDAAHLDGGAVLARDASIQSLMAHLTIVNGAVAATSPRGRLATVVPALPYQFEDLGALVIERGWRHESDVRSDSRPGVAAVAASADYAAEVLAAACQQRLGDPGVAWAYVGEAPDLPPLLDDYERASRFRATVFARALSAIDADVDCSYGTVVIEARFLTAFDVVHMDRLENARRDLEAVYGERWHRIMWIATRLLSADQFGTPAQREARLIALEEEYTRRENAVVAFQRESASSARAHQREMETLRVSTDTALEEARIKANALTDAARLEALAAIETAERQLQRARAESDAKVRAAEEAREQAIATARINATSERELAAENNRIAIELETLKADTRIQEAQIRANAEVAVAQRNVEQAEIRRLSANEVEKIRQETAVSIANIEQGLRRDGRER